MRAVLPSLSHLLREDYLRVYEPSDDTFLLCDALLSEASLLAALSPGLCLEIGCGSATVITYLAMLLDSLGVASSFLATDINPYACACCARTSKANKVAVDPVLMDLASSMLPHSVDVLVFNPPYVPTPNEEVSGSGIEASWAGGDDGRVVIDRLLPSLDSLLSPNGVLYMVLVEDNKPKDVMARLGSLGFSADVILRRKASNERLMILKTRPTDLENH